MHLNELNTHVLAAMTGHTDNYDCQGYPSRAAVKRIAEQIGKDPANQDDLNEVYYSLKFLKMQLPRSPAGSPERNQ
jgi:hypothetical protein